MAEHNYPNIRSVQRFDADPKGGIKHIDIVDRLLDVDDRARGR